MSKIFLTIYDILLFAEYLNIQDTIHYFFRWCWLRSQSVSELFLYTQISISMHNVVEYFLSIKDKGYNFSTLNKSYHHNVGLLLFCRYLWYHTEFFAWTLAPLSMSSLTTSEFPFRHAWCSEVFILFWKFRIK